MGVTLVRGADDLDGAGARLCATRTPESAVHHDRLVE
jgi:hypothetical protein